MALRWMLAVAALVLGLVGCCLALVARTKPPPVPIARPQSTWAESRATITVEIIPGNWLTIDRVQNPTAPPMVSRPFSPELFEVVSDELGAIDVDTLRSWSIDAGELFDAARKNVRAVKWQFEPLDGGVFVLLAPSGASPTALLTWPEKATELLTTGAPVVAFERAGISVADDASPEALDWLMTGAELESGYLDDNLNPELVPLNGRRFTLRDGGWVEWEPPEKYAADYQKLRKEAEDNVRERLQP